MKQFKTHADKLVALLAGLILPGAFAPFYIWPLALLCPAILALRFNHKSAKQCFWLAALFGLGLYATGASWVFVAINDFGMTVAPLAFLMTGIFVSGLALIFAIPFYFYGKYWPAKTTKHLVLKSITVFPALWILGEWLRSWLLTGFPWLYLGYAHTETWLSGWAPIFGVLGISGLSAASGVLTLLLFKRKKYTTKIIALIGLGLFWFGGLLGQSINWTEPASNTPIHVALIQPNVPQAIKWDPEYRDFIYEKLRSESNKHWDANLMVWPEAAIPELYNSAYPILDEMQNKAKETHTTLITGILYDQIYPRKYYNAIIGLGEGDGMYFKQRLVPFGEYVPLEKYLRGLIDFFNLPNSVIHAGPANQSPLHNHEYKIAPFICYEIVYPDLVATNAQDTGLLITISNDAWFGRSIGPDQHFQMAQMRSIETARPLIRATNTGLSGLVNEKGNITLLGEQFEQASYKGEVQPMQGQTLFMIWRSYAIVAICLILLASYRLVSQWFNIQNKFE